MGILAARNGTMRRRTRVAAGTLVVLSTLTLAPRAGAQQPPDPEPSTVLPGGEFEPVAEPLGGPLPPPPPLEKLIDRPASGTDAIEMLGMDLPTAAAVSGVSAEQLVTTLTTDPSALVDSNGALFYAEPIPPVDALLEPSTAEPGPFPDGQSFTLHSKPDSTRKIFLDFDGQTITGTQWQIDYPALGDPFTALPFSLDGNPAFSTTELDAIQNIFLRVSEDYAPFDIDVTTQDPGYAGINRSSVGDMSFGTRVLITDSPTFSAVSGTGIAYVGSIDNIGAAHDYSQPAWVFPNGVSDDTKNIAELVTHESGHNVGLLHDGQGATAYYSGHGPWAPVMGSGYSQPIVQFSKGEYTNANQTQDDLSVVTQNNVPERADDHTNSTATATVINSSASGIISSMQDYDTFKYVAGATANVTFSASPAYLSPNLDIVLTVYDSNLAVVTSAAPVVTRVNRDVATGLDAAVTFATTTGATYYVQVSGGSYLDAASGYTRYGSIGQYTLSIQGGVPTVDCPADDGMENNDDRATASMASTMSAIDGLICANDDDWFEVPAVAGQTVNVALQFAHATGDLDMTLFDDTGAQVALGQSSTDDEAITVTAQRTGLFAVRVYGYQSAQNSYRLTVTSPVCPPDDTAEDNDTFNTAAALTVGTRFDGVACPGDNDYFAVAAAAGSTITVDVSFQHRFGDIDLRVYGPDGAQVAASETNTGHEHIDVAAGATGTYAARFYGYNGAQNVYSVITSVASPPDARSAWPDFNGDGSADRAIFRPASGGWHVHSGTTTYLGLSGDAPVPGDYNGDGATERAVFRAGAWYIETQPTRYLGTTGDIPVPGDYNGDGTTDLAVFRAGAWYVDGQPTAYLGVAGDIPVPGDYNGDGTTERAVYRPSLGGWYVEGAAAQYHGLIGDIPVPADYNGDGTTDRAIYRPQSGGWYVQGQATAFVGLGTDVPVPADYNGDGIIDRAIFRPQYGGWYVDGQRTVFHGLSTDVPLSLPTAIYRTI